MHARAPLLILERTETPKTTQFVNLGGKDLLNNCTPKLLSPKHLCDAKRISLAALVCELCFTVDVPRLKRHAALTSASVSQTSAHGEPEPRMSFKTSLQDYIHSVLKMSA